MLRRSKECVINVPTVDLTDEVVGIGNSSGDRIVKECYASFECQLIDAKVIQKYGLFIWRVSRRTSLPP